MQHRKTIRLSLCCLWGLMLLFAACKKDDNSMPDNNGGPAKGYCTGKISDTKGQPISGAKVVISNTIFYDATANAVTGSDGTYRIRLAQNTGSYVAYATFEKAYNGKTYTINLAPDETTTFDPDGAVRNFSWKLTGARPDNGFRYGGRLYVPIDAGSQLQDLSPVVLVMAPQGNLIDSSVGDTLLYQYGQGDWDARNGLIDNIPIGRYKITAIYHTTQGDYQLYLKNLATGGDYEDIQVFDFEPSLDAANYEDNNAAVLRLHE